MSDHKVTVTGAGDGGDVTIDVEGKGTLTMSQEEADSLLDVLMVCSPRQRPAPVQGERGTCGSCNNWTWPRPPTPGDYGSHVRSHPAKCRITWRVHKYADECDTRRGYEWEALPQDHPGFVPASQRPAPAREGEGEECPRCKVLQEHLTAYKYGPEVKELRERIRLMMEIVGQHMNKFNERSYRWYAFRDLLQELEDIPRQRPAPAQDAVRCGGSGNILHNPGPNQEGECCPGCEDCQPPAAGGGRVDSISFTNRAQRAQSVRLVADDGSLDLAMTVELREDLWIIVTATCRDRVGRWSRYWCQRDEAAENPHECRQEICPVLAAAERVMERLDRPIMIGTIGEKE